MPTFIYKVLRSFIYASMGIVSGIGERNMKVHVFATMIVLPLAIFLQIQAWEWMIVLISIGVVWAFELMNTAVEELSNIVRDELKLDYKATKRARDVAAGAVLVNAIVATMIGIIIFLPKILLLLA